LEVLEVKRVALILAAMALAGCSTTPKPPPPPVEVRVPIPVACTEAVPDRPLMPTDSLTAADTIERKARAALAEIEDRQGYEARLLAALQNCRRPLEH
jgi:type IV pilus biogenesis protein CpaD/CtpE